MYFDKVSEFSEKHPEYGQLDHLKVVILKTIKRFVLTCERFVLTCERFVLTCERFVLTCE